MLKMDAEPGEWKLGGSWIFQWPEWLRFGRGYNWINFDPIRFGIEAGTYKGRYAEVEFVLLGVGFHLELYRAPDREAFVCEMQDKMEQHEMAETVSVFEDCEHCDGMGSLFVERSRSEL